MQCTRCARMLPDNVRFCFFCGSPVTTTDEDDEDDTPARVPKVSAANIGMPAVPLASVNNTVQEAPVLVETDFVFREFGRVSSSARTPVFMPPTNVPSYPGIVPYPFSPLPLGMVPPAVPAQIKARRGRSVGCIVLYAFLAIVLLFTGLGVALYEVGSHVLTNYGTSSTTTKTVAMQLYQHVTSQPPTIQDPVNDASYNIWGIFQKPTYGCTLKTDGLHAHISDAGHFIYCLNTISPAANIAFQIQMKILSGDAGGLVFRVDQSAADSSADSLYFFQVTSTGNYTVYIDKNTSTGQLSFLASGVTQALAAQPGQADTLTVITKGSVFDLYINQQFVVQVHDTTLPTGFVGVLANDDTQPGNVLFTNEKLWYLGQ